MKKRTKLVLPPNLVKDGAKLKNGEEMLPRMIGAYYGSSFELNIVAEIQLSNAGLVECPADKQLRELCRPPKRKGEFGAFKSETRTVAQRQLGKTVFELKDEDEIRAVSRAVDNIKVLGNCAKQLKYHDKSGKELSYSQLINIRTTKQAANDAVQAEKNALLASRGCLPYRDTNGVIVHPSWPEDVLQAIKAINAEKLWSPTGINLKLTVSGLHTIARDNAFYTGSLDQEGLNHLIDVLDYKEAASFFKGRVRNQSITVPIQNISQFKMLTEQFTGGPVINDFPQTVISSAVNLIREDAGSAN